MKVEQREFGKVENNSITAYTITNEKGLSVTCLDYGCIITEILAPDRSGKAENVVLGFDSMEDYLEWSPYFGAVVGRVAGRIKGGSFELDGKEYTLDQNENGNHLHGGEKGFSHVLWKAEPFTKEQSAGVRFSFLSPDGDEGYPGNLAVQVIYELTAENELIISYEGESDQKTILNLTNHSYFNLSGEIRRDCKNHVLTLNSDRFLELDGQLLPTGRSLEVEGTPFDFRKGREIIDGVGSEHPQNLLAGHGYDHPFLFEQGESGNAALLDRESGRVLVVETDQPCVVVYTSNQLSGPFTIRGAETRPYLGVCLETQGLPDAIHHPEFPSIILEKNSKYRTITKYTFGVQ
ncbi:aldose epimerase family protein [Heyndrickxia acidicola]|uniref:Aldose 1-epimerase n=1 Tax=Heyndrickxia acidicola TaxID=209389 RepID=A0ABU6MH83_9BACI|nr:aldose epimerase family protein [Heyndrickxia acidicola]MED1203376.1 galactose mutarotase [Heyndrickxia acidicola]